LQSLNYMGEEKMNNNENNNNYFVKNISFLTAISSLFYGLIVMLIMIYFDVKSLEPQLEFVFNTTMVFFAVYITYKFKIESDNQNRNSLHQAIGGYIPSKSLNELVRKKYMDRNLIFRLPKTNFVTNLKNAKKLLEGLESYDFEENKARHIVVCKLRYNGNDYIAKSASQEMAICIAFLKTFDDIDVDLNKELL
jgi:hypothetical protein